MAEVRINRKELVEKHDPVLHMAEYQNPMQIGNGEFVFTSDVTGLQTLYKKYENFIPLCTMANWSWHSYPNALGSRYTTDDVVMEEFDFDNRKVRYALNMQEGNEEPYTWLRKNPHRYSIARIGFMLDGHEIDEKDLSDIYQRLHLYDGILESGFSIEGKQTKVKSACDPKQDSLLFEIESDLFCDEKLSIEMTLPYGDHHKSGANWLCPEKHRTTVISASPYSVYLNHQMDWDNSYIQITVLNGEAEFSVSEAEHKVCIYGKDKQITLRFDFSNSPLKTFDHDNNIMTDAACHWHSYWEKGAAIRLSNSSHPQALELERRIVLSQYALALQCAGSIPPAETGLTMNSWYGKFHLEMHLWHSAWLPLWNHPGLLEKSLEWYNKVLPKAQWNAHRNGFKGARWPKMVGPEGIDSPSFIATLLIWQQPHILYMLELMYHAKGEDLVFLREQWPIIRETAEFIADLPVYNPERKLWELTAPLIPSEEQYKPMDVKNPGFELAYWKFGLKLAIQFAKRLGEKTPEKWFDVYENIMPPPCENGEYLPHELFKTDKKDFHPLPVGLLGLLPGDGIDRKIMKDGLNAFMKIENKFMIGWVFAYFAMCAVRLGMPETAIELMLMDHPCNEYLKNGHNCQGVPSDLPDLPVYLPGNGGLLLVIALMAVGYSGSEEAPGFPKDGQWVVETDDLKGFPF